MKFLLSIQRRLESAPLLRQHVQQHRTILRLEKLECLDQQWQIVSVDRPEVLQAKFFKHDRRPQHALGGFFSAAHHFDRGLTANLLHNAPCRFVQAL